jgi:hypothetical protein
MLLMTDFHIYLIYYYSFKKYLSRFFKQPINMTFRTYFNYAFKI